MYFGLLVENNIFFKSANLYEYLLFIYQRLSVIQQYNFLTIYIYIFYTMLYYIISSQKIRKKTLGIPT